MKKVHLFAIDSPVTSSAGKIVETVHWLPKAPFYRMCAMGDRGWGNGRPLQALGNRKLGAFDVTNSGGFAGRLLAACNS